MYGGDGGGGRGGGGRGGGVCVERGEGCRGRMCARARRICHEYRSKPFFVNPSS